MGSVHDPRSDSGLCGPSLLVSYKMEALVTDDLWQTKVNPSAVLDPSPDSTSWLSAAGCITRPFTRQKTFQSPTLLGTLTIAD